MGRRAKLKRLTDTIHCSDKTHSKRLHLNLHWNFTYFRLTPAVHHQQHWRYIKICQMIKLQNSFKFLINDDEFKLAFHSLSFVFLPIASMWNEFRGPKNITQSYKEFRVCDVIMNVEIELKFDTSDTACILYHTLLLTVCLYSVALQFIYFFSVLAWHWEWN